MLNGKNILGFSVFKLGRALCLGAFSVCMFCSLVVAEDSDEVVQEDKVVDASEAENAKDSILKPGVVASFGTASKHTAIDSLSTGSAPGDEAAPVSASIAKVKSGKCEARLTNTHEKNSYAVQYVVEGLNNKGVTVMKRSYSATLAPQKTVTNSLSCRDDLNLQVVLRSGKKLN